MTATGKPHLMVTQTAETIKAGAATVINSALQASAVAEAAAAAAADISSTTPL